MRTFSNTLRARFQNVRLLVLDIDGVLTDGRIFWNPAPGAGWTRFFHVRDGYGIKLLMKLGIPVAVLSGGASSDVQKRLESLGIEAAFLGDEDKEKGLEKLKAQFGVSVDQIAFMGDELFDLPVLKKVGLSLSVPEAVEAVRRQVHYVTQLRGGEGAVREVIDILCEVQGLFHQAGMDF